MNHTEEFSKIINNKKKIESACIFILQNDKPQKIKIFPEEVSNVLLGQYFEKLNFVTKDKEFVSYIPDSVEKATLQVLSTDRIEMWQDMLQARNALSVVNVKDITVDDYNTDGNTILVEIVYEDGQKLYFLTRYQRVAAWYRNSFHFRKKQNGKFVHEDGEVLALTPYVDVVIHGDKCYIINETNFNKLFKYEEVIKNQVEAHKEDIGTLGFIGDVDIFVAMLDNSKREKQAMAKVILQNRIEKISKYKPDYIRKQIEEQSQLSFIKFNDDDTIVVDDKSFKAIMDILKGKINLDLITKELNGVDEE